MDGQIEARPGITEKEKLAVGSYQFAVKKK